MSSLTVRFSFHFILIVLVQFVNGSFPFSAFEPSGGKQSLRNIINQNIESLRSLILIRDYLSNNSNPLVPIVKSVEGDVHPCADSLERMGNGSLWAAQMLDASSKLPTGLLQGNLVDLGSYDECVSVVAPGPTPSDGPPLFTGQHCMVNLALHFQQTPSFLPPGVLKTLGNSVPYTFSLCLPSTCSPKTIRAALVKIVAKINEFIERVHGNFNLTVGMKDSDCHVADRPSLSITEILAIFITVVILVLAVIATIIDLTLLYRDENEGVERVVPEALKPLVAFSIYTNGQSLLSAPSADTIQALNGLKFLSIAWVLIGHRVRISAAQAPLTNLLTLADTVKDWSSMILLNAALSVDVFFVISGVLATYIYMNAKQRSPLSHYQLYIHRYIRLTPAFAVMMLVTGTWLYRTGSGPLWDRLVGHAKNSCTQYWWTGLLYISNYYNPNDICVMQSWYLAVDMQLFWLSPLVLYPLKRWPRAGLTLLVTLIIPSIVIPFLVAFDNHIKTPIPISFDAEKVSSEMAELYFPTHTKTIAYVIGMLAGYFLHMVKNGRARITHSMGLVAALWAGAALAMGWALFGAYPLFQLDEPYDRWRSSLYIGLYRCAWSAGVAWLVVACATGRAGVLGWALSWRALAPLGRLTYCVYLTHVAVILYGVGSLRQPQYFSYYDMGMKFLGELVISTLLAALLSLTVEAPVMRLEKILLKCTLHLILSKKEFQRARKHTVLSEEHENRSEDQGILLDDD